jgi:hypothetical protein
VALPLDLRAYADWIAKICGNLKEVSLAPVKKARKHERKRIPVEKSGGGV